MHKSNEKHKHIIFGTRKGFFYSSMKIKSYNLQRLMLREPGQAPLNVAPSASSQILLSQSTDHFREREGIV
jgi:hypothetical protein